MKRSNVYAKLQKTGFAGLIIILLISPCISWAADRDSIDYPTTVKFGFGPGISDGNTTTGGGSVFFAGFQKALWNGRFRLNPNFALGMYSSKLVMDVRDQWFNSLNLEVLLYYDLIRFRGVSLTIGTGGVLNNTRGLLGTGGYPPGDSRSEYTSEYMLGACLGAGIRILPSAGNYAVELLPLNFHIGPDYFMEAYMKISFELPLEKTK